MSELPVTRDDVQGRTRAWNLAPNDPDGAAKTALLIKHPWYRCQSLARAAEFSTGSKRSRLLDAAFQAAYEQDEPNRVVSVSSWPLRVLAEDSRTQAESSILKLVEVAETEPHNLRRAHALQTLAFSVSNHPELLKLITPSLATSILGGNGPRIDRVIRDTFELFRKSKPELLNSLALHHKENRQQQKLLASIK